MNRIIRTVLASVGAVAVVSGGALGVAYATSPAPAQTAEQGTSAGADLNKAADELTAQIEKLQKDLSEPMPTLSTPTPTPTPEPEPAAVNAAPAVQAPAATRAAAKAPAAPAAPAATKTAESDSDEKSGDSKKKESDD